MQGGRQRRASAALDIVCTGGTVGDTGVAYETLNIDGIRAARVGLAAYTAWAVTGLEVRALAAFRHQSPRLAQ